MKKILITGAEGFIGSHLTDLLLKKYKVDALVKYNFTSNSFNLKYIKNRNNLNIIQGDITDYQFLQRISKKTDIIIHLAALIGIPYSYNAVSSYGLKLFINGVGQDNCYSHTHTTLSIEATPGFTCLIELSLISKPF